MSFNESTFKKLGFTNKRGQKGILEASAEIVYGQYITIELAVENGGVAFAGIEVQGSKADEIRREYLKKYSLDEIYKLFTDY